MLDQPTKHAPPFTPPDARLLAICGHWGDVQRRWLVIDKCTAGSKPSSHGHRALMDRADKLGTALIERERQCFNEIAALPANTMEGMALKAQVLIRELEVDVAGLFKDPIEIKAAMAKALKNDEVMNVERVAMSLALDLIRRVPPPNADAGIFDAIQRHKVAEDVFGECCRQTDAVALKHEPSAEAEAAYDAANDASNDIKNEMLAMVPQTVAGARAMLEYAIEVDCTGEELQAVVTSMLSSPLLGGGLQTALVTETDRAKAWIAGARECGLVVFPWRGGPNDKGVMQFGQDEDGPNDYSAASHRFLSHPAFDVMKGCRKGVVFETLCAELGIDPDDVDLCAKVNAHMAQQNAARPSVLQAAE